MNNFYNVDMNSMIILIHVIYFFKNSIDNDEDATFICMVIVSIQN